MRKLKPHNIFLIVFIGLIIVNVSIWVKIDTVTTDFRDKYNYTVTSFQYKASDNVKIVGDLYLPKTISQSQNASVPLVVALHGYQSWRGTFKREDAQLVSEGYIVFSPDLRGHHDSGGVFTFGLMEPSDIKTGIQTLLHDYPQINPHEIGLLGKSFGALCSLLICANNSEIKACVAMAAPTDIQGFFKSSGGFPIFYGVTYNYRNAENDLIRSALNPSNNYSATDILLIHGNKDEIVPYQESVEFYNQIKSLPTNDSLIIMPGVTHSGIENPKSRLDAVEWFNAHLLGDYKPVTLINYPNIMFYNFLIIFIFAVATLMVLIITIGLKWYGTYSKWPENELKEDSLFEPNIYSGMIKNKWYLGIFIIQAALVFVLGLISNIFILSPIFMYLIAVIISGILFLLIYYRKYPDFRPNKEKIKHSLIVLITISGFIIGYNSILGIIPISNFTAPVPEFVAIFGLFFLYFWVNGEIYHPIKYTYTKVTNTKITNTKVTNTKITNTYEKKIDLKPFFQKIPLEVGMMFLIFLSFAQRYPISIDLTIPLQIMGPLIFIEMGLSFSFLTAILGNIFRRNYIIGGILSGFLLTAIYFFMAVRVF